MTSIEAPPWGEGIEPSASTAYRWWEIPVQARMIIDQVAAEAGVHGWQLTRKQRAHRRVNSYRQRAMWEIRQIIGDDGKPVYSLPEIGRMFSRHHSTALFSIRKWEKLRRVA